MDNKGNNNKGIQMFTILMEIIKVAAQKGKGWQFAILVALIMLVGPALVSYSGGYLGTDNAIDDLKKDHETFARDIEDLRSDWDEAVSAGRMETPEVKELRVQKVMTDMEERFFDRVSDAVKLGVLQAMKDHTEKHHSKNGTKGGED